MEEREAGHRDGEIAELWRVAERLREMAGKRYQYGEKKAAKALMEAADEFMQARASKIEAMRRAKQ